MEGVSQRRDRYGGLKEQLERPDCYFECLFGSAAHHLRGEIRHHENKDETYICGYAAGTRGS